MCSPFLARLRVLQTEFQDDDAVGLIPRSLTSSFEQRVKTLTKDQTELLRFPNPVAWLLAVFVEMPLRGLPHLQLQEYKGRAFVTKTVAFQEFDKDELVPHLRRMASHAGLRRLLTDVLSSGCLEESQHLQMQSMMAILAKYAPRPATAGVGAGAIPFTEKRKQGFKNTGLNRDFAKASLRKAHESAGHKHRADAARAARMSAPAAVPSAGAGGGGAALTAFLTSDWDDAEEDEGVYSDDENEEKDASDVVVAPTPPLDIPSMVQALQMMPQLSETTRVFIGRVLAYWCLEGLPKLTIAQIAYGIMEPIANGIRGRDSVLVDVVRETVQPAVDAFCNLPEHETPSSLPALVHTTIRHLPVSCSFMGAVLPGAKFVLVPRGFKWVFTGNNKPFSAGLALVLQTAGVFSKDTGDAVQVLGLMSALFDKGALKEWVTGNALALLNASLRVQDTWMPVDLVFSFYGKLIPEDHFDAGEKIQWKPELNFKDPHGHHVHLVSVWRQMFASGRPLDMSAADGYLRATAGGAMPLAGPALPVPTRGGEADKVEGRRHFGIDTWPPFRSVDAGLHTMTVYRHGFPAKQDDASLMWTFDDDRKGKLRTAEAMEDMVRALSGFVQPAFGERMQFVSEGMQMRQREQQVPLIMDLHRSTYERFVAAGTVDGAALALATSLSPKALWYVAVMAFAGPAAKPSEQRAMEKFAAFQQAVQLAAVAILEALPGPCFPVRLNVGNKTLWQLRPRRKLHDRWCVEVPMTLDAGDVGPEEWEPLLLAHDFFIAYVQRPMMNIRGDAISATTYLMRGILRDLESLARDTDIKKYMSDREPKHDRWPADHTAVQRDRSDRGCTDRPAAAAVEWDRGH